MRTRDLTARLRREITLPSHHRTRDEKSAMLALANKIECAELRLRQLRREAQNTLGLPSGGVVTSGTVRRVNTDRETQRSSRLEALLGAENAKKGPPGFPEAPDMPKASQEGQELNLTVCPQRTGYPGRGPNDGQAQYRTTFE